MKEWIQERRKQIVFKQGDVCVIADVGTASIYHACKASLIDKVVKFAGYSPEIGIVICNGFVSCELFAREDIRLPDKTIWKGQKFIIHSVKLTKHIPSGIIQV